MAGIYSNSATGASAAAPARSSPYDRDAEDAIEGQVQGKKTGLSSWNGSPHKSHHHTHSGSAQAERPQQTNAGIATATAGAAATPTNEEVRKAIGAMFSTSRTHEIPFSVGGDYSPADLAAGKLLTLDMVAAAKNVGVEIKPGMTMVVEGLKVTEGSSILPVLCGAEFVGLPGATYHSGPNGTGTTYHFSLGSRNVPSQTSRINAYILETPASDVAPHQLKIWGKFNSAADMRSEMSANEEGNVAYIRPESRLYASLTANVMSEDGKTQLIKSMAGQFGDGAQPHTFTSDGKVGMIVKLNMINTAISELDQHLFQKQAFQNKRADATKLDIAVKMLNTPANAEYLAQHNKEDIGVQMRELERGSDILISGKITITLLE
jgi:hypothetical protein